MNNYQSLLMKESTRNLFSGQSLDSLLNMVKGADNHDDDNNIDTALTQSATEG